MIPVLQDSFYDPSTPDGQTRGNCWTACIASIVEYALEDVPNFVPIHAAGGEDWWDHTMRWLYERGYTAKRQQFSELDPDKYYVVSGQSPRFPDIGHAVVYRGTNMAHDPYPGGEGVHTPWHILLIEKGEEE